MSANRVITEPQLAAPHSRVRRDPAWRAHVLPFRSFVGERSLYLIERDALADIKPSFKDHANIVPIPPCESAFSNCAKVVERDVEAYRKEAQSILDAGLADIVSHNA